MALYIKANITQTYDGNSKLQKVKDNYKQLNFNK